MIFLSIFCCRSNKNESAAQIEAFYQIRFNQIRSSQQEPKTNESVAAHAISPLLKSILTNAGLQTMDQVETLIREEPEKLLQLRGLGEKTRAELLFILDAAGIDTSSVKELLNHCGF